jgi:hypothetical protein
VWKGPPHKKTFVLWLGLCVLGPEPCLLRYYFLLVSQVAMSQHAHVQVIVSGSLSQRIRFTIVGRPTVNHSVGCPSDNKINKLLLIQFLRIICFKFVISIITDGTDVLTGENRRKRSVVGSAQRHGFYVRNSTDRKPLLRKSRSLTKKQTTSQPSLTLI